MVIQYRGPVAWFLAKDEMANLMGGSCRPEAYSVGEQKSPLPGLKCSRSRINLVYVVFQIIPHDRCRNKVVEPPFLQERMDPEPEILRCHCRRCRSMLWRIVFSALSSHRSSLASFCAWTFHSSKARFCEKYGSRRRAAMQRRTLEAILMVAGWASGLPVTRNIPKN